MLRNYGIGLLLLLASPGVMAEEGEEEELQQPKLLYQWKRQYYDQLEGQRRLLYAQSFDRLQMSFADIDGDQDDDLFIGKADGKLAYFENQGTRQEPQFELKTETFQSLHLESNEDNEVIRLERVIDVGENASPDFIDIDTDGDLDLFIGSKDGTLFYYQNVGNALLPIFELITPNYMSVRPGTNSIPRFQDINADRAPDLLVGTHTGKVYLYKNAGVQTRPLFCGERTSTSASSDSKSCPYPPELIADIAPEIDASPEWVDWDYDGDWDLVIGKASGTITFYRNQGNRFRSDWQWMSDRFLYIDIGGYAAPKFYDMDADQFPEFFIGTAKSKVLYYYNREVMKTGLMKIKDLDIDTLDLSDSPPLLLKAACRALDGEPSCFDEFKNAFGVSDDTELSFDAYASAIVQQGRPLGTRDLSKVVEAQKEEEMVGAAEGEGAEEGEETEGGGTPDNVPEGAIAEQINAKVPTFQANALEGEAPEEGEVAETAKAPKKELFDQGMRNRLWVETRNFLKIDSLLHHQTHTVIATGDWNQDEKPDLILGNASGALFAYENRGEVGAPSWYPYSHPSFQPHQREYSAPALVDIDGDEDLDLLVGNRIGRLELMRNIGTPEKPSWAIQDLFFANIDVGSYSLPTPFDIDNDGDVDLFVGNSRGRVVYYRNDGDAKNPEFVLKSTRFSRVTTERYAAPAFFRWDEDEVHDLLIGGKQGSVSVVSHLPVEGYPQTYGWTLEEELFPEILTIGRITPHAIDLNNDQRTDLMVGDQDGNIVLWLNEGMERIEPKVKEPDLSAQNALEEVEEGAEPGDADGDLGEDLAALELEQELAESADEVAPYDPVYVLVTERYGDLELGERVVPAFFDIDFDGDFDLFVGNKEGLLWHYTNEGNEDQAEWSMATQRFLNYNKGKNAAPIFVDLDQDEDLDLVVGNELGQIHYWENRGTIEFAEFFLNNAPFAKLSGGRNARPSFIDLNENGHEDLLIGNFKGQLGQYIRQTTSEQVHFQLVHRKYLGVDLGIGAAPTIADINHDGQLEMVVGNDKGRLVAFEKEPESKWGWKQNDSYFKDFKDHPGSFPTLIDIDSDGDQDLFIGTEAGTIAFYRNEGTAVE